MLLLGRLRSATPAKGTLWGVRSPAVSFYRILPGKSPDEGRQVLNGYAGTVVAEASWSTTSSRAMAAFRLARCWAHVKRAPGRHRGPVAVGLCRDRGADWRDLYAIEQLKQRLPR
jgi:hypothetical protein